MDDMGTNLRMFLFSYMKIYTKQKYLTMVHTSCEYEFFAASPDGINDDESSPLYGRMLEIKNIVNRDITGIPKRVLIQMQLNGSM